MSTNRVVTASQYSGTSSMAFSTPRSFMRDRERPSGNEGPIRHHAQGSTYNPPCSPSSATLALSNCYHSYYVIQYTHMRRVVCVSTAMTVLH